MGNKQSSEQFDDKFGKKQPGRRKSFFKKVPKKSKNEDNSHQSPIVSGSKYEKSVDSLASSNVSTTKNSPALTNKTPESNKIQIKIFRSITNLNDNGRVRIIPSETPTNFRVFKKNVSSETLLVSSSNNREQLSSLSATSSPYLRSYSLPRAFGKNKMARTSATLSSSSVENFDNMKSKKLISRSSMTSTSRRVSAAGSIDPNSKNYKVSQSDFPEYDVVLRRLVHFKQIFIINLVNNLLSLPLYKQISLIPLATVASQSPSSSHAGLCNGNKEEKISQFMKKNIISLKKYLEESELGISSTLTKLANSPTEDTVKSCNHSLCHLHIPKKFVNDLLQLKSLWRSDACLSTTPTTPQQNFQFDRLQKMDPDLCVHTSQLTSKLFSELTRETADEIIRIYEYQIGLLNSELSIEMLASHCVDRIMTYIKQELNASYLDRNILVLGVLKGQVRDKLPPAVVSVIIGQKELKWNLYDIFDKPGLRRDVLLEQEDITDPTTSCKNLFNFYAAPFSNPMVYGYRGQIIEMDYTHHAFTAFQKELETFCDDVFWRYDDFHRLYVPFQLMIGTKALRRFADVNTASLQKINTDNVETYSDIETNISPQEQILNNYVINMLKDTTFEKSSVKVLCRPFNMDDQICYLMQLFNPSLVANMHQNNYLNDETSVQLLNSFFVFGEHVGTSTPLSNSTTHNTSSFIGGTPVTPSHIDMNKNKPDNYLQHQDRKNKTTNCVIDQQIATTVASLSSSCLADKEVNVFATSPTMQNECQSNGSPHLPSIR